MSFYGKTICNKHDDIYNLTKEIMDIISDAKEDGIKMENALAERKKELEVLNQEIGELNQKINDLQYQISNSD